MQHRAEEPPQGAIAPAQAPPPCRTAEGAAALRVWHTIADDAPAIFDDRAVRALLGPGTRGLLDLLPGSAWGLRALEGMQPELAALRGQAVVRARFAEDALDRAVADGCRQLLILGAGLDTTGLRRPDLLRAATLTEVDRPSMQAWKRDHLPPAVTEGTRFVPVDFQSERLDERLSAAGVSCGSPLFATWLGCTYYLSPPAIQASLAALGRVAAPGSELVLDYWLPTERLPWHSQVLLQGVGLTLASQQDPLIGLLEPDTLARYATEAGWRVAEERTAAQLHAYWLASRRDSLSIPAFSRCARLVRET